VTLLSGFRASTILTVLRLPGFQADDRSKKAACEGDDQHPGPAQSFVQPRSGLLNARGECALARGWAAVNRRAGVID
jgi:hypothetical protein